MSDTIGEEVDDEENTGDLTAKEIAKLRELMKPPRIDESWTPYQRANAVGAARQNMELRLGEEAPSTIPRLLDEVERNRKLLADIERHLSSADLPTEMGERLARGRKPRRDADLAALRPHLLNLLKPARVIACSRTEAISI
jgi:hypothetical protein